MSLIVSVYSKTSFVEQILPSINNTDYFITVRKSEFRLREDLRLRLEVLDDVWRIRGTNDYCVMVRESIVNEKELLDGDIIKVRTQNGEFLTLIVSGRDEPFVAFEKYHLSGVTSISIGRSGDNDIVYKSRTAHGHHAQIIRTESEFAIRNLGTNGIYVNGNRIDKSEMLKFGDFINIVGLHMVFLGDRLAIDVSNQRTTVTLQKIKQDSLYKGDGHGNTHYRDAMDGKAVYHRAPRPFEKIVTDPIEIEEPPGLQRQKTQSMMSVVGPSLTMAIPMFLGCLLMIFAYSGSEMMQGSRQSLFLYSGMVMAVSSAILGAAMGVSGMRQQKKDEKEQAERRLARYSEYLLKKTEAIRERYDETLETMKRNYPEAKVCLGYDEKSGMLWNRNREHSDFLVHRMGTGDIPFQTDIAIPPEKFRLEDDSLAEKPAFIRDDYRVLFQAPVTLDLREHKVIGVIGGPGKTGANDVIRTLIMQIAAGNCYTDVKLGFIYDGQSSEDHDQWSYFRWLPHTWSEDRKIRYVASNRTEKSEVLYELTKVIRARVEDKQNKNVDQLPKPYYIVVVSGQSMLEGEPFFKYVDEKDDACGLTTIILAESYEQLPNSCDYIIENTTEFQGCYGSYGTAEARQEITFDVIDVHEAETFARKISSLEVVEVEEGGEIPETLTFFEMMKIRNPEELNVRELWAKNRTYENIRGQVGEKAGGTPCYLDVHEKYHGPHGLVAGTTGSGKSETLQTYLLSLAVNYGPDDIAFFIIDFKGGGMANLFEGMPHLIGHISNLSGNQIRRAMISIKSENRRRQQIFAENGVNQINKYTELYKNGEATVPIPHLFIVVDEFAELKREEPDFMLELISVAQVGRSLGVHLILSTQKPSGTVDENIWSNSKFRLCLRVQDRQDSMDMLHKPDAANITQAGRCYLQVGNDEVYELFQSGYSGAPYDENIDVTGTDIARMISLTGKTDMTGSSVKQIQKKNVERLWVEKLISALNYAVSATGVFPESAVRDPGKMRMLQRGMYTAMASQKIDYPQNRHNSARLEDLVELYLNASANTSSEIIADHILDEVDRGNRKLPQIKERTELDAVKDHLAVVANDVGYKSQHKLWLPTLSEKIYLSDFQTFTANAFSPEHGWKPADQDGNLAFIIGQWDDPANQNQMPFYLDLSVDGNIGVCGSVVSGKSTSLQTIAYSLINRFSPAAVNLYVLDFSSKMLGAFEDAPHTGGVMFENDLEKVDKFFNMIMSVLDERKNKLRGGTFAQYAQISGEEMAAIVIMIDNYGGFKEKTGEKYEDIMIQLSKEGINHGIFLIVSGGGFGLTEITNRIGDNLNTMLTLSLQDKFAYGDLLHTMQIDILPEQGIKGRGLARYESRVLEYQTAMALEAGDDYQRMDKIRDQCRAMRKKWTGRLPRPIPEIPEKPDWGTLSALEEYQIMRNSRNYLPVGYNAENASVWGIDLSSTYCFGVYGRRLSGKTNFMKICALAAIDKKAKLIVIDSPEEELRGLENFGSTVYTAGEDEVESIYNAFNNLLNEFSVRNARKNELRESGREDEELFPVMAGEFTPIFVLISDLIWFIRIVYEKAYVMGFDMRGALENIITKGQYHNIYFIADVTLEKQAEASSYPLFTMFTSYRTGIHFGGKVSDNGLLSFDYLDYREQEKSHKNGIGLLPDKSSDKDPWKIIVPMARTNARHRE